MVTPPTYTVTLGDARSVKARYQSELSHGGCFVPTHDKLAAFSVIRLRLELPVGPAVELMGRVVNQTSGGVFVQFEPGPERDALDSAIEFLESIASAGADAAPDVPEPAQPPAATPPPSAPAAVGTPRGPWALLDRGRPLRDQLPRLSATDRVTLARFGDREVRDALIADSDAQVVAELLGNPRVVEAELLAWLTRDDLSTATLESLAQARVARCRPRVLEAIAAHPRLS